MVRAKRVTLLDDYIGLKCSNTQRNDNYNNIYQCITSTIVEMLKQHSLSISTLYYRNMLKYVTFTFINVTI